MPARTRLAAVAVAFLAAVPTAVVPAPAAPAPRLAAGEQLWSGTFTYTGTWEVTRPYGNGTIRHHAEQRMTASLSATLTPGGEGRIGGQLTGPASGSGSSSRILDYVDEIVDPDCGARHYITTEEMPETEVGGATTVPFVITDDGGFTLLNGAATTVPVEGSTRYVVTPPCAGDTTWPTPGYLTVPARNHPMLTGTVAGGTRVDVEYHLQDDGWDATFAYHLTRSCADGGCEPAADAGGPYSVARAWWAVLSGSGSGDPPLTYTWTFAAADTCPPHTTLRPTAETGASVVIVPLCDLVATLTVRDRNGRVATGRATVTAEPRPFTTEVTHHEQPVDTPAELRDPRTPPDEPVSARVLGKPGYPVRVVRGANVSRCGTDMESILCPYVPWPFLGDTSRLGRGYSLAVVEDPGGPFDGYYYVDKATMSIDRLALYNPWLGPAGPVSEHADLNFYHRNLRIRQGQRIAEFLARLRDHEGEGVSGKPETGHTGALRAAVAADPKANDPNRVVEDVFGPTLDFARDAADLELTGVEEELRDAAKDPRPEVFRRPMYLWDPQRRRWNLEVTRIPGK